MPRPDAAASGWHGLSGAEARQRLARFGANDIDASARRSALAALRGIDAGPLFGLALAASTREARLAAHQHDSGFERLGLLVFEDPLGASVPAALADAPPRRHLGLHDHRRSRCMGLAGRVPRIH